MPFLNYSSDSIYSDTKGSESAKVLIPKPKKFTPYRHSSPPVYDCSSPPSIKDINGNPTEYFEIGKEVEGNHFIGKKSSKTKLERRYSPEYFALTVDENNLPREAITKTRKQEYSKHRHYSPVLFRRDTDKTTTVPPQRHSSLSNNLPKRSNSANQESRREFISDPIPIDLHGVHSGFIDLKKSPTSKPIPLINEPSEKAASPQVSPSVRLRNKKTNSPKGNSRRRGVVWDSGSNNQSVTISSPVLISHQVIQSGVQDPASHKINPRAIEEQEELLRKLQLQSESSKTLNRGKQRNKQEQICSQQEVLPHTSASSKMAERIQRTIKALYSSNVNPRKNSFDLLDEDLTDKEPIKAKSVTMLQEEEFMLEPCNGNKLGDSLKRSPKADKRANRKRSPKPSRRNNLQVKDVDGSRRFKWRGSVNRIVKKFGTGQPFILGGTFGVHLEDCPPSLANEFVPFVVEICCRIVEGRGLHFTGIYRVPGNNASLSSLQDDLNQHGVESIDIEDDRLRELNVVSSLLKSFFRKLPDPLFTNELYNDFIQGNRKPSSEERLNSLRRLVHMLPGPHYETLKFLINHLRLVADNCDTNKMEVRNLAIVFGPTLVRSTASDNVATMVTDMSDQCRIVESIIEHAEWFFNDSDEVGVDTVPQSNAPADRSHEPVPSIEFLLNNVGRKPGDASGNTSDSSKSKCSNESEKDSFSRDVIDLLFGKKWKQATNRNNIQDAGDSADEHGGFEDPHRRKARAASLGDNSTMLASATLENPNIMVVPPTPTPILSHPPSLPVMSNNIAQKSTMLNQDDVSERLLEFYREHLERLSRTTIGQTPMTFSSTESSPQITPRNSQFEMNSYPYGIHVRKRSVENFPLPSRPERIDYMTQMSLPSRSQPSVADVFPVVSSDNEIQSQAKSSSSNQSVSAVQSEELANLSHKPAPSTSTPVRNDAPAYRHPPNPYVRNMTKGHPQEQHKMSQNYFSDVNTDVSSISSDRSTLQGYPLSTTTGTDADDEASDIRKNSIQSSVSTTQSNADGHDSDTSEMSIYVGESFEEKLKNLTNLDKTLERRPSRRITSRPVPQIPLGYSVIELGHQNTCHEMLVDEPVPVLVPVPRVVTSPTKKVSSSPGKVKLTNVVSSPKPVLKALKRTSPGKPAASQDTNVATLRKSTQELYEEKKQQRMEQKRMKVRMKTGNATPDENMFNRFDPKRRVIRTSSGENENPLHSMANRAIPSTLISANSEKHLSAKERLFDMKNQPHPVIRQKPTLSQERKKQRVVRRHTLSGIADFPDHSVWIEDTTNSAHITSRSKFPYNYIKETSPPKSALSMYDLAYSSAAQNLDARNVSAVDRLKPKGATSEMTLSNWMVRERLKNGPARRNSPVVRDNNNLSKKLNHNGKHKPLPSNSYV